MRHNHNSQRVNTNALSRRLKLNSGLSQMNWKALWDLQLYFRILTAVLVRSEPRWCNISASVSVSVSGRSISSWSGEDHDIMIK